MAYPERKGGNPSGINIAHLPVIDTPFTRLTEHWATSQGGVCRDYELDYVRCEAAVGGKRAKGECRKFLEDWMECKFKLKTKKRYEAMTAERKKQKRPYIETPPPDSIFTPCDHE